MLSVIIYSEVNHYVNIVYCFVSWKIIDNSSNSSIKVKSLKFIFETTRNWKKNRITIWFFNSFSTILYFNLFKPAALLEKFINQILPHMHYSVKTESLRDCSSNLIQFLISMEVSTCRDQCRDLNCWDSHRDLDISLETSRDQYRDLIKVWISGYRESSHILVESLDKSRQVSTITSRY